MLGRGGADEHAGARADAVEDLVGHVVLDRHAESFDEQAMIKRPARADVADRELNVRDALGEIMLRPRRLGPQLQRLGSTACASPQGLEHGTKVAQTSTLCDTRAYVRFGSSPARLRKRACDFGNGPDLRNRSQIVDRTSVQLIGESGAG